MKFHQYRVSFCFFLFISFSFAQELSRKHWSLNFEKGLSYLEKDSVEKSWTYLRDAYFISKAHYKHKSKYKESLIAFYKSSLLNQENALIDSLNLTTEVLNLSKSIKRKNFLEFFLNLDTLAQTSRKNKQFDNAIRIYSELKKNLEDYGIQNKEPYAKVLYGLGKSYKSKNASNTLAKDLMEQSLAMVETYGPFTKLKIESVLTELVSININLKDEKQTDILINRIRQIVTQEYGEISKAYGMQLHVIGNFYYQNQFFDNAYDYQTEAIKIFEQVDYTENMDYLRANYYLGLVEEGKNNYSNAIDAFKKVQGGFMSIGATDNDNYARVLGKIALNYDKSGDFENAMKYCNEALTVAKITKQTKSKRLMDKGYFFQNMGQYEMSHKAYEEALEYMKKALGETNSEYAKLLNNIGKLYYIEGDYENALRYFKNALAIIEKPEGETWHMFYSYMLNDYAKTSFELGNKSEAVSLMEKNLAYFEAKDSTNNEAYFNRKSSLAKAYNRIENYQDALPLIEDATIKLKQILGEDHVDLGQFLNILSQTYFGLGEIDKAVTTLKASNGVFVNQIDKIFRFSSQSEKKDFLQMIMYNFNQMQSIAVNKELDNPKLNSLNLNNQLMLKGLLLNNSKDILIKLKSLQIPDIDKKIRHYKNLKNQRTKALIQYSEYSKAIADSLSNLIDIKESDLVKLYSVNFQNSASLIKDWQTIKNQLDKNDVAIEFSHFNVLDGNKSTEQIQYVAYIFNASDVHPKMIRLFEESELNQLISRKSPDELYNSDDLYTLIWKPIEHHIVEDGNVFYSPSGLLNQISFAAITTNHMPLILKHKLIQLSSTFKLTEKEALINTASSLLIGGVTYDYRVLDKNKDVHEDNETISYLDNSAISKRRGTKSRGESWNYLEGTLNEIESLNTLLTEQGATITLLKSDKATESEFKKVSGNSPSIMHIATHGFFYENLNRDTSLETNLSKEDQYRLAEDPLLRSGLILAGANYVWKNGNNPFEPEDGILTAMEISNLDLSTTDLVVLSACETGLGDIDGSEGVYGLQRAFIMAGVNRLIMSLWEVPDAETALFMKTFYNNWFDGNSIREAFIKTQRELHQTFKNHPSKWAAFVLFE